METKDHNVDQVAAVPKVSIVSPNVVGGCRCCGHPLVPWIEGTSEIGVKCSHCEWSWMDFYA